MPKPLWQPSDEYIASTNLTAFQTAVAERYNLSFDNYFDLHRWSVEEKSEFWRFYAEYAQLPFSQQPADGPEAICSSDPMPHTKWFEGATLNYAEALLFPKDVQGHETAITALNERSERHTLSYNELRAEVAKCAAALKKSGVTKGDRVAAYIGNIPEAIILLLGCASIGAVFSSGSPDFGYEAALARFGQIEPKVLVGSDSYYYNSKHFDTSSVLQQLTEAIPSINTTVYISYGQEDGPTTDGLHWQDWLGSEAAELSFEALPFDHPLYVLYSSGTTGLPKAIVHRAGGALLKHHVEGHIHSDIKKDDVVLYFTTCGWMMWNWLVTNLAHGANILLFEGSPSHPDLSMLWKLVESEKISFFGTGARFIHSCKAAGVVPNMIIDMSSLKTVASTGSPLSHEGFRWVYEHVKEDLHLASISGGTDIVGCFMLGVPTLPVYSSQIQAPALGVDLVSYNDDAQSVQGETGELICRQSIPSMPLGFWGDDSFERYKGAYLEYFEGVWRHGDLIEITAEGGVIVYGRSDATLNPGGVRIGTAEIYRPLESMSQVIEALAVGKKEDDDEVIWLFVVLAGVQLDELLEAQIKGNIRRGASPRHVPKKVIPVKQLPRTRSGKTTELAVARLVNGRDVTNRSVMANPEALDEIAEVLRTHSLL